ncbi:uncharacterized protein LOC135961255 [Calliphora vicina]|uniref:uncharacterized protein LOC135961255 n=1 Tax=Calliphora vicina TaxID=7373 RepID=UPI00325A4D20
MLFSPERNSNFERQLFRSLKPEEDECLNKCLLRLRGQAAKCQFGETKDEILGTNLKDKLIDTWAPNDLKKRLLEKEFSLSDTIEMCHVYEQINNQSETMKLPNVSVDINRVENRNQNIECCRCGQRGHTGNSAGCPAKRSKCNKCGFIRHVKKQKSTYSNIQFVADDKKLEIDSMQSKWNEHNCFRVTDSLNEHMNEMIECYIGGRKISVLIDSGSQQNLLSEKDWEYLCRKQATVRNIRSESENQFRAYFFDAVIGLEEN